MRALVKLNYTSAAQRAGEVGQPLVDPPLVDNHKLVDQLPLGHPGPVDPP